jgi:hypothetical protein
VVLDAITCVRTSLFGINISRLIKTYIMKNNSSKKRAGSKSGSQQRERQTSQNGNNKQPRSRSMSNNNGARSNGK